MLKSKSTRLLKRSVVRYELGSQSVYTHLIGTPWQLLEFSFKEWHEGFNVERTSTDNAGIEKGEILNVNAGSKNFKVVVLVCCLSAVKKPL